MQVAYEITFWHWTALCLLLLIVEMSGAGGYLLWIGIAAGITGGLLFVAPELSWQIQVIVFSVASVTCTLAWWKYQMKYPRLVDEPLLNKRGAQYIGRVFTLSDAIENGRGKIRVDDSFWEVSAAEDMPVGMRVKILTLEHDQIFRVERQ
jgi:membrane protein implicated in regulation of membrane protease activity